MNEKINQSDFDFQRKDRFTQIVILELRDMIQGEELDKLLNNLSKWKSSLVLLKQDVEIQFSSKKADLFSYKQVCIGDQYSGRNNYFKKEDEYNQWRKKALWFKFKLEQKIAEVNDLFRIRKRDMSSIIIKDKWLKNIEDRLKNIEKILDIKEEKL